MDNNNFSPFTFIASRVTHIDFDSSIFIFEEKEFKKSFKISTRTNNLQSKDEKRFGEVTLEITIDLDNQQTDENNKKASIRLTIEGGFSAPESMPNNQFENMLRVNGAASLYSIARGYLISLTSQSFVRGQVVLPLVNFIPKDTDNK